MTMFDKCTLYIAAECRVVRYILSLHRLHGSARVIVRSFVHIFGSKPANFHRRMPLLTDLPNGINDRISVGYNFFIKGAALEGHAHN